MDRYQTFRLTISSGGVVPLEVARHAPRTVRVKVADPAALQHVATVTSTEKASLPVYEVYFADGGFYSSGLINAQAKTPISIDPSCATPTINIDISGAPGTEGVNQAPNPSMGPILADYLASGALIINGLPHYRSSNAPFLLVSERTIEKIRLKVITLSVTTRYPRDDEEIPMGGFPLFDMEQAKAFLGREVQRRREECKGSWFVDHWVIPSTISIHFDGQHHHQAMMDAYRISAAESMVRAE